MNLGDNRLIPAHHEQELVKNKLSEENFLNLTFS